MGLSMPSVALGAAGVLRLDNQIRSMKKAGVGPVKFPHARHQKRFKCKRCHPRLFKKKRGASRISMKGNMDGRFCGACHNGLTKTFPLFHCTRCHTNVTGPKGAR